MELESGDSSDNPPSPEDSPGISQFIENMGLHYQQYGLSRISGRILGLLLVTPQPISSEEMAEALQVSRSSISTNLRTLLLTGLIEKVSLPGNRVDFFILSDNLWQKALELRMAAILPLRAIADQALESLDKVHPARDRMEEMVRWVDLVDDMAQRVRLEWQSLQEVPAGSG
ncbi:MAG TPA: MarR family transcriptional regulator [Levilinea sp.]|nr:MarR family transcriptional regulator [Levilinea sp.]